MLRNFLACHITASFWLLLVLVSAYITGKSVEGVALEFYFLVFTTALGGLMTRSGLDKLLGAEEK